MKVVVSSKNIIDVIGTKPGGSMNDTDTTDRTGMGYWVLTGRMFLEALRRAHAGENPEDIFYELYEQTELLAQG